MAGPGGSGGGSTRNPIKIVANIFISFIGAGVLGLPYAFKRAGLMEGIIVMCFVSYFSIKAMLLIIDCKYKVLNVVFHYEELTSDFKDEVHDVKICGGKPRSKAVKTVNGSHYVELKHSDIDEDDNHNKKAASRAKLSDSHDINYSDIGFAAFGLTGRTVIDTALLTSQIGFCCAYLIFISENLSTYVHTVQKNQWLVFLLPPLFFLTLIKDLGRLAVFSLCAQISNLFAFTVVYWFDFQHIHLATVHPKEFSIEGFPYYFCIAIYCFEGAGMILTLESSMAADIRDKFRDYFVTTIMGVTSLYITFGAAGYLSYGPETKDIITLNLPSNEGLDFPVIIKGCLCFSLFFTYPIMLFPVTNILEKKMSIPSSSLYSTFLRLCIVSLTGVIVIQVPNFGQLMALVGASCCTLLAFIMPGLCHLVLFRHELEPCAKLLDFTLIGVGIVGAIIGTVDALFNSS